MKAIKTLFGGLMLAGALCLGGCTPPPPVRLPELPLADVTPYFSEAAEVQTIDTSYYLVKDAKGHVLGTVLLSAPYSTSVHGYNGPTPLLIALDAENRIKDVVLMANQETPRFAQRVEANGFYASWNGLTVEEAMAKQVDAVSGATFTSEGVKGSLALRLEAYQRQLSKDYASMKPSFWQRLFALRRR